MIKVKIMTGSAVPIAKRDGNAYPYADDKAKGISVPKNKTNIVGQKAREKRNPIKNEPAFPCLETCSEGPNIEKDQRTRITPVNRRPETINKGPINLRNHGK